MLDEAHQALRHAELTEAGWVLHIEGAPPISVELADAVLLRSIDGLLEKVSGRDRLLFDEAWKALELVRDMGYSEGSYSYRLDSGRVFIWPMGRYDIYILRYYDALLERVSHALRKSRPVAGKTRKRAAPTLDEMDIWGEMG